MESRLKEHSLSSMLIVEDDPAAREFLGEIVSRKYPELELHFAPDGETGVELFARIGPRIVLTDLSLPGMSGLGMVKEIRKLEPRVQIVVLTASNDSSKIIESMRLGISRYVVKPIEVEQLFEAVDESLRRVRDIDEAERAERLLRDHRNNLEALVRERTAELKKRNEQLATEVCERRRVEQEVVSLNAGLEQRVQERTAELEAAIRDQESFSYSVSHDLRAPLRHINSYSMMLEEALDTPSPEAQHCLERIKAATIRMANLIDHLLELSRISRSVMTCDDVELSEIARGFAAALTETAPQRKVEFAIEDGLRATGDRILLRQLLENLIGNAWKYSSLRPTSRIEFGRTTVDREPCYFVRDNGVGFDMNFSQRLFQAFERLHGEEFEGLGIGLATVKRIIHRHSGRIWADSTPDQGATFYFTLCAQSGSAPLRGHRRVASV